MIIDILALRKICIKEAGIDIGIIKDPQLADVFRAESPIKDARNFLRDIGKLYADSPKVVESEIIKEFNKNCVNTGGALVPMRGKKKYLAELIWMAYESKKISGETYHNLRGTLVRLKEYSPEFQKEIEQRWRNEYSTNDGIYDILQGNENKPQPTEQIQPQLAAVAARKTKEK
jgi:hypothetical protein